MKSPLDFFFNYEIISKPPETPYSLLINKKTKEHLLLKEVQLESHNLKEIVETLEEHRSLEHENLLGLIDYSIGEEEGVRVMRAFYNVGSHSLLQQIRARQQQSSPLEQQQLWGIMYGVVMALSYLQKNNIGYGVISLESIYLTTDGKTKVVDPSVASNPLILNTERYYSPEMLKILHQRTHSQEINIFKSDVFVLALCLIHCSILQPVNECINYDTGEVDFDMLEETLSLLPEGYSEELVKLIVKMLDENVQTRPDFKELEEYLSHICTNEVETPLRRKGEVTIFPMSPDTEDIKSESVYPNEMLDYEMNDKVDGDDDSDDGFQMPKLSIMGRPKESLNLENTLNLSDSLSPNKCKTFASSRNSSDTQQFYSVNTLSRMKHSVKGSKQVKQKVMQNHNFESLGPPEATESRHMLESSSLAPYLPQKPEQQLFTDPRLLLMLKEDLKRLSERTTRAMTLDKENQQLN